MENFFFQKHLSKSLNELYSRKNYQGVNPFDTIPISASMKIQRTLPSSALPKTRKFNQIHNMMKIFLLIVLISPVISFGQNNSDCNCPEPSIDQYTQVCQDIMNQEAADDLSQLSYKYQESLWELACANPKTDSFEDAKTKIQCMWKKYRQKFRCYNYSGVSVADGNILKFAMDKTFPTLLLEFVKKYELDMNFKDPADGLTILDFIDNEIERYKLSSKNYDEKITEYKSIRDILIKNGAKKSTEL